MCRFDGVQHGPPQVACSCPGTNQTQDANQDWNQVLDSMSLWAMQPSVKALTSGAQEVPMRWHFGAKWWLEQFAGETKRHVSASDDESADEGEQRCRCHRAVES